MKWMTIVVIVGSLAFSGCGSDDDGGGGDVQSESGDRELLNDEVDDVRAEVADCFVVEVSDGSRRYQTTIEVRNGSDTAQTVTVTVDAGLGRGGVSDSIEVPAGASDAFAVTADEETTDDVGDVECADYVNGINIDLGPSPG